jgi:nitrite reductase/ring-hydroxylating ferredoxin subunit
MPMSPAPEEPQGLRRLCHLSELPDRASRGFDADSRGRDSLFIVRRGDQLVAWRNACPHIDGAPMAWRKHAYLNANGSRIVCSAHGAQFDIDSGECLLGPCLGQRLTPVALSVDEGGEVFLIDP